MRQFYKLALSAITAMLVSFSSFAQCPSFDITVGATEVSGSDFVCDGTNVTVQWNDVPGATGYRLRVGNNATYDNLDVSYVVDGGGAGPFQSTFSVPAATNGTFYTYTVDYSTDSGFSLGTAAGADYDNPTPGLDGCAGNAETFKVSLDPTDPTAANVATGSQDGVNANEVCANASVDIEITEGANGSGDLGEYFYRVNGGTWVAAGSSSTFTVDATVANGFVLGGGNNVDVAASDQVCTINDPITTFTTVAINVLEYAVITGINFDADNGNSGISGGAVNVVNRGDVLCFDGSTSPYDQFDISYVSGFDGSGILANLSTSTDSGATDAAPPIVGFASGSAYDITAADTDYAFWFHNNFYCQSVVDTFHVSTTNSPDLGADFLGLSAGGQGAGVAVDATNPIIPVCTGQDGYVDISGLTLADIEDVDVTEFSVYDITAAGRIVAPVTASTVIANLNRIDIPAGSIVDGNSLEVRVHDCNGNTVGTFVADSEEWSFSVNTPSAAGDSKLEITREDNATLLANNDKVCENEALDIVVTQGTATLGTNGEMRVYKSTDNGTTFTQLTTVAGAGTETVTDHVHGTSSAIYVAALVSDCDSIPVFTDESLTVDVFTTSGNLTAFAIAEASLADNLACNSESITLQATPSTLGDDSPVVEFFTSIDNDPLTLGDNVSLGNGAFNVGVGAYELNINFGNSPVYYFAALTSECNSSISPVSSLIDNHDETVTAPTVFDISEVAFAGTDLGEDITMANDTANPICKGTEVFFTTDGDLLTADDGSEFYWEIDTTSFGAASAWVGLDTTTVGQISLVLNDTANIRVRIAGGCNPASAWVFATVNLKSSSLAPNISAMNADGFTMQFDDVLNIGTDSVCSSETVTFMVDAFNLNGATDNPTFIYEFNNAPVGVGSESVAFNFSGGGGPGFPAAEGEFLLIFSADCQVDDTLATVNVTFLDDNVQDGDGNLDAVQDTNNAVVVMDNQFVCAGTEVTFINDGTLGEATNGRTVTSFEWEVNDGINAPYVISTGTDSSLTLPINATTTVASYIAGGCNPAASATTANFTVNVISAQNNFTNISLTQDNYCADEAATLPVTMTATGVVLNNDLITKVVWYSMDDAGNPVTKLKSTLAGTAGADKLFFNGGDGLAPDTTTTIGVRLESCDTSAFEVRIITVKDLPKNQSASGAAAVVSASPSAVCSGSSSTLSIINYIVGTNGQVTWYDDAVATNLLATGPSFTPSNITSDTTFYVRIEADCDTTAMLSVDVNLSTIDPTAVTDLDVPAFICEKENIIVTASGSTGDGSYIWEVSFDGVVFSSISDGTPGDDKLSFTANNLNFVNNTVNVTLRASRTNGCITTATYDESFEVRELPSDLTSMSVSATEACVDASPIDVAVSGGDAGYDGMIEWTIQKTAGTDSVVTQWADMAAVSFDWAAFDGSGEYTISAKYTSGVCGTFAGATVSKVVTVYELPTNDLAVNPIATLCASDTVDLGALSSYAVFEFTGPGVTANMYYAAAGTYAGSKVGGTESLSYSVTENGCTSTFTVEVLVNGTPEVLAATPTAATCNTADGTIKVTSIDGGVAPYAFATSAAGPFGFAADSTITGLAGGSHDVYVQDANGCTSLAFAAVVPSSTGFSVTGSVDQEVSCNGEEDGAFTVVVAGGLSPYSYVVTLDGNAYADASGVTTTTYAFTSLAPGTYVATFTDAAGCSLGYTKTFVEPSEIGLTVTDFQEVQCNGESSGVIGGLVATSSNGGPFEYALNGGDYGTSTNFTGLAADDYLVSVKDGNGCEKTFLFSITEPDVLTVDTTVVAIDENGYDVEIDAAGGTPAYEYSKGGAFQTSNLFSDLASGNYTFTVRDDNGCETEMDVFLAPVGIKENAGLFASSIASPNPFNNEFVINGVVSGVEITITDIYGKRIDFVSVIKDSKATITTGEVASGVYFTTIRKGDSVATFRMVKN